MKKNKVYVGLSGGVDSSVTAYLLKKEGYEVIGVFIKGWQPDFIPCTWKEDRLSALRTAAYLDIPFITLDLENEYKNKVVKYLLNEYEKGNTPNPDMLCNKEIKFGVFLDWAKQNNAGFIATGHYIKKVDRSLYEALDKEKDQSYFLSQIKSEDLRYLLFPLGEIEKKDVRKIANDLNLPVASRKDSQGICFVGDLSMKDFLIKELNPQKGKVINEKGEIIGEHNGALLYTIGERHGFTIFEKTENKSKYYIKEKDLNNNILIVSDKKDLNISNNIFNLLNFNYIKEVNLMGIYDLQIRLRYRGEKIPIKVIEINENKLTIKIESEETFDNGQFGVIYSGEEMLGGGEIKKH